MVSERGWISLVVFMNNDLFVACDIIIFFLDHCFVAVVVFDDRFAVLGPYDGSRRHGAGKHKDRRHRYHDRPHGFFLLCRVPII